MELRQQFDINTTPKAQKSSAIKAHSTESDKVDLKQDKPFEDELNTQIKQTQNQENSHKSDNNQQDESMLEDTDRVGENQESHADAGTVESLNNEEVAAVIQGKLEPVNVQPTANIVIPSIATQLPETGSTLPLSTASPAASHSMPLVADIKQAQVVDVSINTVSGTKPVTSDIELSSKRISDLLNKTPLTQANKNSDQANVELRTTKTITVPSNLTATLSEKANLQDARYTKIMSEMPTTDVITQTTRMQQVPLTTAISASQSSIQNVSTALITEPASLLTNSTPLSNTLSSSIATNLQNPNWSQQMTQQVAYMIKGGFQQADIKLNPAHLGPMEIKLSLNDDNANINFVTQHAPVRDAIDAALPRLKEMLEQQGLNLSDANVSTQSEQQQASAESQQGSEKQDTQSDTANDNSELDKDVQQVTVDVDMNSGVSIFA